MADVASQSLGICIRKAAARMVSYFAPLGRSLLLNCLQAEQW